MTTAEIAFQQAYANFQKQVGEATQIWYTAAAINEESKRRPIEEAIQECAMFWITVRGALEQYAIVVLGRVFDQSRGEPQSIDRLLKLLRDHREELFSKAALRERRKASISPERLEHYIAGAPTIRRSDIDRLGRFVRKYRKIYEQQFEAIRHKELAHSTRLDAPTRAAMYARTNTRDLERLIRFLNQLHGALMQLYYNGSLPRLRPMRHSVRTMVKLPLDGSPSGIAEGAVSQVRTVLAMVVAGTSAVPRRTAFRIE
jgi:hypothetical protein